MRLDVEDVAELAVFDPPQQFAEGREETFVGADPEHDPGPLAGLDRALGLGLLQGQRLFAKHRLAAAAAAVICSQCSECGVARTTASMLRSASTGASAPSSSSRCCAA